MQHTTETSKTKDTNLSLLSDFCKEELGAAETYKRAMTLDPLRKHTDILSRCYASHQQRASELRQRITELGGSPPTAPGAWSSLVPTLTSAAAAVSESLAVSLLEESEDRGVRRYREHTNDLDPLDQTFVNERLMPGQAVTHAAMSELKLAVSS
ncbi:MAG TPA: DUF2383 domain-containing protein [Polyangiaceae bacterium]|nr:DUF2383 domain-containing protein [Polyangiaceae bacterium]